MQSTISFFVLADEKGMDAQDGLTPHPLPGRSRHYPAGSGTAQHEQPVENIDPFRPGAPWAYSLILDLLETLRNLVLSGHEPAPYLSG